MKSDSLSTQTYYEGAAACCYIVGASFLSKPAKRRIKKELEVAQTKGGTPSRYQL
jgi:hypothetical protein